MDNNGKSSAVGTSLRDFLVPQIAIAKAFHWVITFGQYLGIRRPLIDIVLPCVSQNHRVLTSVIGRVRIEKLLPSSFSFFCERLQLLLVFATDTKFHRKHQRPRQRLGVNTHIHQRGAVLVRSHPHATLANEWLPFVDAKRILLFIYLRILMSRSSETTVSWFHFICGYWVGLFRYLL